MSGEGIVILGLIVVVIINLVQMRQYRNARKRTRTQLTQYAAHLRREQETIKRMRENRMSVVRNGCRVCQGTSTLRELPPSYNVMSLCEQHQREVLQRL